MRPTVIPRQSFAVNSGRLVFGYRAASTDGLVLRVRAADPRSHHRPVEAGGSAIYFPIEFGLGRDALTASILSVLILTLPPGFLAPLRWHRLDSVFPIVAASVAFSVLVELLQFILPTGRQNECD
jgi:hypothetical protein